MVISKALRVTKNKAVVTKARRSGCKVCGDKRYYVLDFHHRDPGQKDLGIADAIWNWSPKRLQAEIDKCDVLCANCHRALHWKMTHPGSI